MATPPVLAWAAGTAGLVYENRLIGLSDVLGAADEEYWHEEYWQRWIAEDLRI